MNSLDYRTGVPGGFAAAGCHARLRFRAPKTGTKRRGEGP